MKTDGSQKDIPELKLDKTKISVLNGFDDTAEIEYWRNSSIEQGRPQAGVD